jgi:hypothetical protein
MSAVEQITLAPQAVAQLKTELRAAAREAIDANYAAIRYSHERGLSCECGNEPTRYQRFDDFEGAGTTLNADLIAQLVAALRPIVREIIAEVLPAPQPSPEQAEPLVARSSKAASRAVPLWESVKPMPRELTARYSRQAMVLTHQRRQAGAKTDYEATLRELVAKELKNDQSPEFRKIRFAAEADITEQKRAAAIGGIEQRVKRLEQVGPSLPRREKFAKAAAERVHVARLRGQKVAYAAALSAVYSEAGVPMPQ